MYIIKRRIYYEKIYKLEELDCANCAAKMEAAINKIEGVEKASVSFMTQKLIIEAEEARLDKIMKKAVKVCKKSSQTVESSCN